MTKIKFLCLHAELFGGKIAPHIQTGTPSPYGMVVASQCRAASAVTGNLSRVALKIDKMENMAVLGDGRTH